MHNITEVLLKNHQIMPYKRKTPINNFGVVKNKCCTSYTNNNSDNYSKNNNKFRKMSPLMFLLIVLTIIELCCMTTGVDSKLISTSTNQWNSIINRNKIISKNNNLMKDSNKDQLIATSTTKDDDYLKSLHQVFISNLRNNNSNKNGSSIDKVRYFFLE